MNNQVLLGQFFYHIEGLRKNWKWFLGLGILLIVLGLISIAYSSFVTLFSIVLFGVLLLLSGISQLIFSFWARKWSGFFLSTLAGILYTVTGILLISKPIAGAMTLTLLFASFCLLAGLFRIVGSLMLNFDNRWWVLLNGIITFLLGILILADWPEAALWVFGLFIGIDLIFTGWAWIFLALTAKNYTPLP